MLNLKICGELLTYAAPFVLKSCLDSASIGLLFLYYAREVHADELPTTLAQNYLAAGPLMADFVLFLRGVPAVWLYITGNIFSRSLSLGQNRAIGTVFSSTLFIIPLITAGFVGITFLAKYLIPFFQPMGAADIAGQFLSLFSAVIACMLVSVLFEQLYQGMKFPWIVVALSAAEKIMLLAYAYLYFLTPNNLALNLGFSLLSTAITAAALRALTLFYLLEQQSTQYLLTIVPFKTICSTGLRVFKLGLPYAGYAFCELMSVNVLVWLVGSVANNDVALVSAQASLRVSSLLANLMFAFGHAAGVLLSGADNDTHSLPLNQKGTAIVLTTLQLGLAFQLTSVFILLLLRNKISLLFVMSSAELTSSNVNMVIGLLSQVPASVQQLSTGLCSGLSHKHNNTPRQAVMIYRVTSIVFFDLLLGLLLSKLTPLKGKGAFIARGVGMLVSSLLTFQLLRHLMKTNYAYSLKQALFSGVTRVDYSSFEATDTQALLS